MAFFTLVSWVGFCFVGVESCIMIIRIQLISHLSSENSRASHQEFWGFIFLHHRSPSGNPVRTGRIAGADCMLTIASQSFPPRLRVQAGTWEVWLHCWILHQSWENGLVSLLFGYSVIITSILLTSIGFIWLSAFIQKQLVRSLTCCGSHGAL